MQKWYAKWQIWIISIAYPIFTFCLGISPKVPLIAIYALPSIEISFNLVLFIDANSQLSSCDSNPILGFNRELLIANLTTWIGLTAKRRANRFRLHRGATPINPNLFFYCINSASGRVGFPGFFLAWGCNKFAASYLIEIIHPFDCRNFSCTHMQQILAGRKFDPWFHSLFSLNSWHIACNI